MKKGYSREDEYNLPQFNSHDEARAFFKEQHGNDFQLVDSDFIGDKKIYFYYLILDHKAFDKGQQEMNDNGVTYGMDFLNSFQKIEIWEDGNIHMLH